MTLPLCVLACLALEPPAAAAPAPAPAAAEAPAATPPAEPASARVTHEEKWAQEEPIVVTGTAAAPVAAVTPPASATAVTPEPEVDPYTYVPFDIGLVPGLSINGRHRGKKVRNKFSLSFGWSRAARVDGIALAFGATVVDEDMEGVAASLGANITRGAHRGLQFSNGYNYAGELRGVQNGAVNHAGAVKGLQIGLINIGGHVKGAQIGLVNWAESADASFALLPITKEGGVRFEVSTSDTAAINVGLRFPARHTYMFMGGGLHPFGTKRGHVGTNLERGKAWEFGGGFGGHVPVTEKVFIDIDLSAWGVTSGLRRGAAIGGLGKLRAMVGWQAAKHVALFAGPTLNVLVDALDADAGPLADNEGSLRTGKVERPGYGWVAWARTFADVRVRVWPGFVAGLRF